MACVRLLLVSKLQGKRNMYLLALMCTLRVAAIFVVLEMGENDAPIIAGGM
jgi:hypothetical protein